jgi:molecular chaperone GrpE
MTALQIVNGEDFPPMKELINLYKTALLDGNDEVLGEVEKAITALEKEKSMAASQLKYLLGRKSFFA